ncbi:hypothetical protein AAFF_G00258180 [Aldrovandia affinis]|uniref:Uncharacterized protein n=1 Tax=Aldrovandia affinis TaxID=143900 RepID=A0AAD7WU57_9TELE|nr:hypothetical protein AAFF_G00258180 [Aldrovandia affinis]
MPRSGRSPPRRRYCAAAPPRRVRLREVRASAEQRRAPRPTAAAQSPRSLTSIRDYALAFSQRLRGAHRGRLLAGLPGFLSHARTRVDASLSIKEPRARALVAGTHTSACAPPRPPPPVT